MKSRVLARNAVQVRSLRMVFSFAVVLLVSAAVKAADHEYQAIQPNVIRNVITQVDHVSLEAAKAADAWGPGQHILLDGGTYDTGQFVLDQPGLMLECNDSVLQRAAASFNSFCIEITADDVSVFGPATLRNTGVEGGAIRVSAFVTAIESFLIRDVVIDVIPARATSPISIRQTGVNTTNRSISGMLDNVVIDAGNGHPDGIGFSDDGSRPSIGGTVYAINCRVIGCNQISNSNAIAVDTRMLCVVIGGEFGNSGGPNLIGADYYGGELEVTGAITYNGNLQNSGGTFNGDIVAQYVDECSVLANYTGVELKTPRTDLICELRNSTITLNNAYWAGGDLPVQVDGISVKTLYGVLVDDCVVDYGYATPGSNKASHGLFIWSGNKAPIVLRDSVIRAAQTGVRADYVGGELTIENCAIEVTPEPSLAEPAAIWTAGLSSLQKLTLTLDHNLIVWRAASTGVGRVVRFSPGSMNVGATSGHNVYWIAAPSAYDFLNWPLLANEMKTSRVCENPVITVDGVVADRGALDLNENGVFDAGDLTAASHCLLGDIYWDEIECRMDLGNDGVTDGDDLQVFLNWWSRIAS